MRLSSSLPTLLYRCTEVLTFLCGVLMAGILIAAVLVLIGWHPQRMNESTFEVPLRLDHLDDFYRVTDLDDRYVSMHIEAKHVELEVQFRQSRLGRSMVYFIGGAYVAFFFGILMCLTGVLRTFHLRKPFPSPNVRRLRWMAFLTIGLAVYQFLLHLAVLGIFRDKFSIENASIYTGPLWYEINYPALFLGFILWALAEVFRHGADLQDLESHTV